MKQTGHGAQPCETGCWRTALLRSPEEEKCNPVFYEKCLINRWSLQVTNGTYSLSSSIYIDKQVVVRSVHGAVETVVDGGGSVRCFDLESACIVDGFTISNGYENYGDGGGVYCFGVAAQVNNCIITENSADSYASGGGMCYGTANNCLFTGNFAQWGGGMRGGVANNCTFVSNSAGYGGGMHSGTANNSISWYNSASSSGDDLYNTSANYTCSPDVSHGSSGCITNAPIFSSLVTGNFTLSTNSALPDLWGDFFGVTPAGGSRRVAA